MHISRIQVAEGFLDGLNVELTPGLNVIIGARGTGKTSIVELIRYCLDVPGHTPETSKRSRDHALSILGTGEVTLTLSDGKDEYLVSRGAGEAPPHVALATAPIVFSQTEIETVGLQSAGRLRLIDGFIGNLRELHAREEAISATIHSTTVQIDSSQRELDDLNRQLSELPRVEVELANLAPSENELQRLSAAAAEKTSALNAISQQLSATSVDADKASRALEEVMFWRQRVSSVVEATPGLSELQNSKSLLAQVKAAAGHLQSALAIIADLEASVVAIKSLSEEQRAETERKARALRQEVEQLKTGSGAIVSTGMRLRERKAQLLALSDLSQSKASTLRRLMEKRASLLDTLEEIREERFSARRNIAQKLSVALGPRIKVSIRKSGRTEDYASAIAEGLRGSGLRYGELAPQIAENVSPRELVTMAEAGDAQLLTQMVPMTLERASRVLASLRQSSLATLATVLVEDDVTLELLDGKIYKDITDLSTGQRCTTVLPIVLQHSSRIVVIDQPEDHIDNAFIAETLVRAIVRRPPESQLIVSTHNANIPVLGDASTVIQMGSDGKRGFVDASGNLEQTEIVDAISAVMEGGKEAFARRAAFYSEHSNDDS